MRIFPCSADMLAMRVFPSVVLLMLCAGNIALAQNTAVGVVWTPDGSPEDQVQTLQSMRKAGIVHVRTAAWPNPKALQAAHAFGLNLYVDISSSSEVTPNRQQHLGHPAVRGVGWTGPLTARGCAEWRALRMRLPPALARYVVAPVDPSGAACTFADSTTVLADVRLLNRPFHRWYAWKQAHNGTVGLAAMGPARTAEGPEGWHVRRSTLAQARALETLLQHVHARGVPWAFTATWSSASDRGPLQFHLSTDAQLLPPGRVVAAATAGAPRPFAWPPGPARTASTRLPYSATLVVGLLLLGAVVAVAQVPPVRRTVLRYLFAHGFYRESLRGGRDATQLALAVLTALLMGALWGGGWVVLYHAAWTRPVLLGLEALPPALQSVVSMALHHPGKAALAVATGLTLYLMFWATLFTLVLQKIRSSLSWTQMFTVGLMPWWGTTLWMMAALIPSSSIGFSAPLVLLAVAVAASTWSAVRTGYDLYQTAHPPVGGAIGAALLAPGSFLLFVGAVAGFASGTDVPWILHLVWYA